MTVKQLKEKLEQLIVEGKEDYEVVYETSYGFDRINSQYEEVKMTIIKDNKIKHVPSILFYTTGFNVESKK